MSGMKEALCPLRMNVVSANAASPSGAGSAAGTASTTVGRARSSARTAMTTSFVTGSPRCREESALGWIATRSVGLRKNYHGPDTHQQRDYTGSARLRLEVVRVVREDLAAVGGDEHQVLETAAAVAVPVDPGLDGDDVPRDELAGRATQRGLLVDLEADAVAERVVEAVLEDLAGLLG